MGCLTLPSEGELITATPLAWNKRLLEALFLRVGFVASVASSKRSRHAISIPTDWNRKAPLNFHWRGIQGIFRELAKFSTGL